MQPMILKVEEDESFSSDDPQLLKYNIERRGLYTTYKNMEKTGFAAVKQQFAVSGDDVSVVYFFMEREMWVASHGEGFF